MPVNILAVETSCDETSVSVLRDNEVLSNIISSQAFHSEFGGIVPELASRAQIKQLDTVAVKAFADAGIEPVSINLTAATRGPGLIGSLLTGLNYTKAFAIASRIRFIGINHIEAHLYSCFIGQSEIEFPFLALVVSGGHTILILVSGYFEYRILGQTQDDAAGEAFDKGAKMLGFGYPGGPLIDRAAKSGNENFYKFPVASVRENIYDFSFSGIKTSLFYYLKKNFGIEKIPATTEDIRHRQIPVNDICASYQKAIVISLTEKISLAAEKHGIKKIAVSGGVSANSKLRDELMKLRSKGYDIFLPAAEYTTDNAAMVGYAAYLKSRYGKMSEIDFEKSIFESAFARFSY
jgi:N6-L-threonylcarbamoyladenine synthase